MNQGTILFRTDANSVVGAGHLMRCLALACGLREAGRRCVFVTKDTPSTFASLIDSRRFPHESLRSRLRAELEPKAIVQLQAARRAAGIVIDRYGLPKDYARALAVGRPDWSILQFDDTGREALAGVDIVLNQNFHATRAAYRSGPARRATLLCGPRYALLRPEFRVPAPRRGGTGAVREILVTMGGGEHQRRALTPVITGVLAGAPEATVTVAGGFSIRKSDAIVVDDRVKVIVAVRNMAPLYRRAGLALTGAGSTLVEVANAGVPAICVVLADNQNQIAKAAHGLGIAVSLGDASALSQDRVRKAVARLVGSRAIRERMVRLQRSKVDGKGVDRVVRALEACIRRKAA